MQSPSSTEHCEHDNGSPRISGSDPTVRPKANFLTSPAHSPSLSFYYSYKNEGKKKRKIPPQRLFAEAKGSPAVAVVGDDGEAA